MHFRFLGEKENPVSIMQSGNRRCLSADKQVLVVQFQLEAWDENVVLLPSVLGFLSLPINYFCSLWQINQKVNSCADLLVLTRLPL